MINLKKFKFCKILILLKTILLINFMNNSYCKQKTHCSQSSKQKGDNDHKYKESIFIDLPEKIEDYNEDLVKQIKNSIHDDEKKDKITIENLKNFVKNEIEMIKNRECKEYKKEELNLDILYIIKDNDLIASKIYILGDIDNEYYVTVFNEDIFNNSYDRNYQKTKKSNIDLWYENYLKEGVYSFDKLKEFWNTYNPTYLASYKKYPVFYFEKNETNKQYFEDVEEDKKK